MFTRRFIFLLLIVVLIPSSIQFYFDEDSCVKDESDQCRIPTANSTKSDVCNYVKCNDDDCEGGGYFPWTMYVECADNLAARVVLIVCAVIYMLLLFAAVSTAADDFFSPSIAEIVAHLKISESVAGVTFMAFGNGAPDVFGSIASVLSSPKPKADLALGELFGAGLFVTTMVLAVTIISKPFHADSLNSIRDIIFYLIALCLLTIAFVCYDHVAIWMPVSFLGIYVIYVITVITSQIVHRRTRNSTVVSKKSCTPLPSRGHSFAESDETDVVVSHGHIVVAAHDYAASRRNSAASTIYSMKRISLSTIVVDLVEHLKPYPAREDFIEMNILSKVMVIVTIVPVFFFKLTIPLNETLWSKPLALIQAIICPPFILFCIQLLALSPFKGSPPLVVYSLIVSAILFLIIYVSTSWNTEPKYYKEISSYLGFIMSIAWIYLISSEVVGVVTMIGVVSRVSHELLGLTILAWSNSIGDLIADVSVAKQGYPRMAMAAAIGGQLFNLLIGFGLPFSIAKAQNKQISLIINPTYRLLMLFLAISLTFTLAAMFIQRFNLKRIHGFALIAIYGIFFVFVGLSLGDVLVWK